MLNNRNTKRRKITSIIKKNHCINRSSIEWGLGAYDTLTEDGKIHDDFCIGIDPFPAKNDALDFRKT